LPFRRMRSNDVQRQWYMCGLFDRSWRDLRTSVGPTGALFQLHMQSDIGFCYSSANFVRVKLHIGA
jgi:hypothetical protein